MEPFKFYRKKRNQMMRPYEPGENMSGISVSEGDVLEIGGMIVRNTDDPTDQWYVSKEFFQETYEEILPEEHEDLK